MLVERDGDPDFVKVLDFGIAKVPDRASIGTVVAPGPTEPALTQVGMVYGTPEYMAPEQALGQSVDARADLYALGVMTFEMLAGCRPFIARTQVSILGQQIAEGAPRISRRAPGVIVPRPVERFVRRLLEREPSARFQSADEVLEAIDKQLGYAPSSERVPTRLQGTGFQLSETDPAPSDFPRRIFPRRTTTISDESYVDPRRVTSTARYRSVFGGCSKPLAGPASRRSNASDIQRAARRRRNPRRLRHRCRNVPGARRGACVERFGLCCGKKGVRGSAYSSGASLCHDRRNAGIERRGGRTDEAR